MRFITLRKRGVLLLVIALVCLSVLSATVGVSRYAGAYLGTNIKESPIYIVDTEENKVALTFEITSEVDVDSILAELASMEAKATFFVSGVWADKNPETLKKIDAAGMEIGTSSYTYPRMTALTESQIRLELEGSANAVSNVIGKEVTLFRTPYGEYSDKSLKTATSIGFLTVQGNIDTRTFENLSPARLAQVTVSLSESGSIIMLGTEENSMIALPLILAGLKNKGFESVTAGELLYTDNYTVDSTGKQSRKN